MSDSSNEQDESSKNPSAGPKSNMFTYLREVLFLFALAITSYATLFNSLPKVGKPPPAVPFFPVSSVVQDYYRGTMGGAFEHASKADIAVVMFYAPWDAESQAARPMFDAVARFFRDEVYFAAVSCWAPSSECRQHYPKIWSFPVIVAYPQQGSGIQYKGPLKAGHLVRFIRAMMKPIQRIHSMSDIAMLFAEYDAVVVGSFDFEGNLGGRGYYIFYSAALKLMEKDFYHHITFAVTTNSADAAAIQVKALPSVRMFKWNETLEFPLDADYNEDSVSSWVNEQWNKVRRPARWLHLSGTKSMTLAPYLADGPTLFVFSPDHPLLFVSPVYNMIKEISFKYFNCDNNPWLTRISDFLEATSLSLQSKYQRRELSCARLRQEKKTKQAMTSAIIAASALANKTECSACEDRYKYLGPQLEVCIQPLDVHPNVSSKMWYDTSMWRTEEDDVGPSALLSKHIEDECYVLEYAYSYSKILFPRVKQGGSQLVQGLSCKNNRTLSIVALDSLVHYQLAEGLGINILDAPDKTAAVIVDNKSESSYYLNETLSQSSLIQFILRHTDGLLERHLRSTDDRGARTLTRHSYHIVPESDCIHTETESCVPELHSKNFLPTIMDPTKAVIVFYHTLLCAMCRSVSHIFLLVARYFRYFPNLRFVRIDGERNSLPWRYDMESFPALLFFPTLKKEESRVFSENLPFTVRTIMHFVLANLEAEAKIPAMLSLCKSFERQQTKEEKKNCKAKIQAEIQNGLSISLRRMRSVMARLSSSVPESAEASALYRRRSELLLSLQFFRASGFVLGSVEQSSEGINEVNELYQRYLNR